MEKLLPNVQDLLFPQAVRGPRESAEAPEVGTHEPAYLVLDKEACRLLLPSAGGLRCVGISNGKPRPDSTALRPEAETPVELYLSPHGIGVVTFSLRTSDRRLGMATALEREDSLRALRALLYHAVQTEADNHLRFEWDGPSPGLRALLGGRYPEGIEVDERAEPMPVAARLVDLAQALLPFPWRPLGMRVASINEHGAPSIAGGELALHAAIQFAAPPGSENFEHPDLRRLAVALSHDLALAPPPTHPGPPAEQRGVETRCFTPHHLASVASTAVHVIVDEPDGGGSSYNTKRPVLVSVGYFAPFLIALQQRWHAQLVLAQARRAIQPEADDRPPGVTREGRVPRDPGDSNARIAAAARVQTSAIDQAGDRLLELQRRVLDFRVFGEPAVVSNNPNFNAWYDACRSAMHSTRQLEQVRESLGELWTALSARRSRQIAEELRENVARTLEVQGEIRTTQHKVEWIELILVTIYVVKLAEILSKSAGHDWWSWSFVVGAVLLGGLIGFVLVFSRRAERASPKARLIVLALLLVLLVVASAGLRLIKSDGASVDAARGGAPARPLQDDHAVPVSDLAAPASPSARSSLVDWIEVARVLDAEQGAHLEPDHGVVLAVEPDFEDRFLHPVPVSPERLGHLGTTAIVGDVIRRDVETHQPASRIA
ncbi:MAG TPA: hypothetical protein PKC43_14120 [Phycisphaerales bacterium]|nr:hypothetical protein [Phycisphaerales bacterium]HMP38570.1 hypothetical protein [Phycisphaerales bacterium]